MLLKPFACSVGEHIVPGDVAGLSSGVDDIIPALVIGSSWNASHLWLSETRERAKLCKWAISTVRTDISIRTCTMDQYTLRNRFRSKRLCESRGGPPPTASASFMQPLRDKLALLSHGRQNLTKANACLMEVLVLFIVTVFLIFLCRIHSSYYREAR